MPEEAMRQRFIIKLQTRYMARHPLEFAIVWALAVSACFQIVQGPAPSSVLYGTNTTANVVLSVSYIFCAVFTTIGAIAHGRNEPLALYFELAGVSGIGVSLMGFTALFIMGIPHWYAINSAWAIIGLMVGFIARAFQIVATIRKLLKLSQYLDQIWEQANIVIGDDTSEG